jgi:hypothetical protein
MAEAKKKGEPLMKPATVRALAAVALAAVVIALAVDAVHGHVSHFGFDGVFGFYALLGLVSGLVIIGVAKGVGALLSRPDAYYGEGEKEAGE